MLKTLAIRNFVLIDDLNISFSGGLGVFTGETGGGKTILLEALNLSLGDRADPKTVKNGTKQATITAVFDLPKTHAAFSLLGDQGVDITPGEEVIIRRVVAAEGQSRAFLNDQPVTAGLLKLFGETLVEVHGQHDDRGLLNPKSHRALLDAFGGHEKELIEVANLHADLEVAKKDLSRLETDHAKRQEEEEFDRDALSELQTLNPKEGEEAELAIERKIMMEGERSTDQLAEVITLLQTGDGVEMTIRSALRRLERLSEELKTHMADAIEALAQAAHDTERAYGDIQTLVEKIAVNKDRLENIEERLFEYRALARKHKCQPDDLAAFKSALMEKISALESGNETLAKAREKVGALQDKFHKACTELTAKREKAAGLLDKGVTAELPPLKMEKARFKTLITPLSEDAFNPEGAEKVEFQVSTNPGSPFGPLIKIASGGELARFILALKVVLAKAGSAPTLIFDEVDRGVGGAVADAVGERLSKLAQGAQVLVVTHSPQVAARADTHFQVQKTAVNGSAQTEVKELNDKDRKEEIARMLSGATVTDKARAAAESLIAGGA